jgi:Protein of unknown function (DUF3108)
VATGSIAGFLRLFSDAQGSVVAEGRLSHGKPVASNFQLKLLAGRWSDEIGIVFSGNRAKETVLPTSANPSADYVPIKDADRVGASDPMTALLVYVGGNGATTVPQACERTVAIFDGHTRYDLRLAFERFGMAHPNEGYQGEVVVCSAKFLPVAGYDPKHFLVTYLAAQHETEIWLAPLSGTRLLVRIGPPFQRQWALAYWRQQSLRLFLLRKMCVQAIKTTRPAASHRPRPLA